MHFGSRGSQASIAEWYKQSVKATDPEPTLQAHRRIFLNDSPLPAIKGTELSLLRKSLQPLADGYYNNIEIQMFLLASSHWFGMV